MMTSTTVAATGALWFCEDCGRKNARSFCKNCGAKRDDEEPLPVTSAPEATPTPAPKTPMPMKTTMVATAPVKKSANIVGAQGSKSAKASRLPQAEVKTGEKPVAEKPKSMTTATVMATAPVTATRTFAGVTSGVTTTPSAKASGVPTEPDEGWTPIGKNGKAKKPAPRDGRPGCSPTSPIKKAKVTPRVQTVTPKTLSVARDTEKKNPKPVEKSPPAQEKRKSPPRVLQPVTSGLGSGLSIADVRRNLSTSSATARSTTEFQQWTDEEKILAERTVADWLLMIQGFIESRGRDIARTSIRAKQNPMPHMLVGFTGYYAETQKRVEELRAKSLRVTEEKNAPTASKPSVVRQQSAPSSRATSTTTTTTATVSNSSEKREKTSVIKPSRQAEKRTRSVSPVQPKKKPTPEVAETPVVQARDENRSSKERTPEVIETSVVQTRFGKRKPQFVVPDDVVGESSSSDSASEEGDESEENDDSSSSEESVPLSKNMDEEEEFVNEPPQFSYPSPERKDSDAEDNMEEKDSSMPFENESDEDYAQRLQKAEEEAQIKEKVALEKKNLRAALQYAKKLGNLAVPPEKEQAYLERVKQPVEMKIQTAEKIQVPQEKTRQKTRAEFDPTAESMKKIGMDKWPYCEYYTSKKQKPFAVLRPLGQCFAKVKNTPNNFWLTDWAKKCNQIWKVVEEKLIKYVEGLRQWVNANPKEDYEKELYFEVDGLQHSILCINAANSEWWLKNARILTEKDGMLLVPSCCHGVLERGITPAALMEQEVVRRAQWIGSLSIEEDKKMIVDRKKASEIFRAVEEKGWTIAESGESAESRLEFLNQTLLRYGRMNGGVPDFRAIVNRRPFKVDEDSPACPLTKSPRLQLKISREWVEAQLPVFYEECRKHMCTDRLHFSILYSEGLNFIRSSFVGEKPEIIDREWVLTKKTEAETDVICEDLRQTAHKDIVDSALTKFKAMLPKQAILALDTHVDVHLWLDADMSGYLGPSKRSDWGSQLELYKPQLARLEPGDAVVFHAFQTHAGDGASTNFRLFVSATPNEAEYQLSSFYQSYFEVDKKDKRDYGEYMTLEDAFVDSEEKDYDDAVNYEDYFTKLDSQNLVVGQDNSCFTRAQLVEQWGGKWESSGLIAKMVALYGSPAGDQE